MNCHLWLSPTQGVRDKPKRLEMLDARDSNQVATAIFENIIPSRVHIKFDLLLHTTPPCALESKLSGLRQHLASGGKEMLWTIFVILLLLWVVGLVSSYTLGGFIHLLLVAAVIVLILRLVSGRRPVV